MLALCQHNTLAYYAFYYAGIFDAGLCGHLLWNPMFYNSILDLLPAVGLYNNMVYEN